MYEYDVFLSYKRGKIREEWLHTIFLPLFEDQLEEALGKRGNIFIDKEDIPAGVDWIRHLGKSIARSRCLIAIVSPSYFASEWCMKEFVAMYTRQLELEKLNQIHEDISVVLPFIKQGPTEAFPKFITRIQLIDYRKYNKVGEAFRNTQEYLDMQAKIENDARRAADIIKAAPEWKSDFEKIDWLMPPVIPFEFTKPIQSKPGF